MSLFGAVQAAYSSQGATAPPVPYTSGYSGTAAWPWRNDGRLEQLDLTTQESTLLSVLDLISSKTAEVEWELERVFKNPRPEAERRILSPEEHLAAQLWEQPNDFMDGQFLRQMVTWHYDAVGEGRIVVDRFPGTEVVRSLWPVRPDRLDPIPSPKKYLVGYMYTSPDGEKVPLDLDEVLSILRPNPMDPQRGLGIVQGLLIAAGTSMTSQQWIRAFFRNDARPGGVVELGLEPDEELTDDEFKILKRRWNETHEGVSRANRVGFLERGTWKDVTQSIKDMEYSGIRNLTRDQILEAFRIHKHHMGIADDVNRANATASKWTLAENTLSPRLGLWRKLANGAYLRMFGDAGRGVKFSHVNPSPTDPEMVNAERTSKAQAFKTLIDAGVDPADAAQVAGLPPMRMKEVAGDDARPALAAA